MSISIKAGSAAQFIFTGRAHPTLLDRWQASILPSALVLPPSTLVGGPKSFFKALTTTQQFTSPAYRVLASIAVPITAEFSVLELLGTFSFVNNNSDSDVDIRFILRDSVNGILNGAQTSAPAVESAAGAVVFRGTFAPGLHVFTLEVAVFGGPISIGGIGENGNASLYIQQMSA